MANPGIPVLKKISESDQSVGSPEEDVRGRTVVNTAGEKLGTVEDLLIDEAEGKVRFLLVEHGGFLGLGQKKTFVPVDAVSAVGDDEVRVDRSREQVSGAPAYDPDLVEQDRYAHDVYRHFDVAPFWGPGYVYPTFPRTH
ncbi:PRC-barrel domain-containing protein [Streptomyces fradiae]|uniref:PRC-barrel domain-containing protein n=1 Tax=Streptomyces fradiae TaxID=1906 RepID=UPI0029422AB9|nr:PRC-barrel domain-containing protein [Streptomyces fradiae]WOI61087.1 PRC-barrel domain-containing protein [Streptomyces fradiae]